MPLIQNRKSKFEQWVSMDQWKVFQEKGLDSRYTIVDDSDLQQTVIKKPEIFDFIEPDKKAYEDITKDGLKEELTDLGVEFADNATKKELYQLYIDG